MDPRMYPLPEAARVADVPLGEIEAAVRDGLLPAVLLHNTGGLHVSEEDLSKFIRRTRHRDLPGRPRRRKVLLLGEELLSAGTLRLEFQRDPRVDVRSATWGKDAVMLASHFNPDLVVADLSPSKAAPDETLCAVRKYRKPEAKTVVFAVQTREEMEANPLAAGRLATLRPDVFVSRREGMRALLVECFRLLGLDTNTVVLRRKA